MFVSITRSVRRSQYIVSRIESTLTHFAEGKSLDGDLVSLFIENQTPDIQSVSDLVFMTRLVNEYVKSPSDSIREYLKGNSSRLLMSSASFSSNHLSVLLSALAEAKILELENITALVAELLGRTDDELRPRVVSRICKALARLEPSDQLETWITKTQQLVNHVNELELHVTQFLQIASLAAAHPSLVLPKNILQHGELLVPFMSDGQARLALSLFTRIDGEASIVQEIKKNLVRARPRRAKSLNVEDARLPEVQKAPYFAYVRKLDLR
jgi:hypothetical protein